jgi:ankyrin repeat protein
MAKITGREKLHKAVRIFGPFMVVVGALLAILNTGLVLAGVQGILGLSTQQIEYMALAVFIVGGASVLLRQEMRSRAYEEILGNEHARALWADGIPATEGEYLNRIRAGDYSLLNRFWNAGIVNKVHDSGRSDLHTACEAGHALIAEEIIRRGGDPRRADKQGNTPLMLAIPGGHTKVVDKLLQHDCAINATATDGGYSALFIAAHYGHTHIVDMLLKEGAIIDRSDSNNVTPLMAAIAHQKWDVANQLIDAAANLEKRDASGATLMDYALRSHADEAFLQRLRDRGITRAEPQLEPAGSGSGWPGKINVQWRRSTASDHPPNELT